MNFICKKLVITIKVNNISIFDWQNTPGFTLGNNYDVLKSVTHKFILPQHMEDHTGEIPNNSNVFRINLAQTFIQHGRFQTG